MLDLPGLGIDLHQPSQAIGGEPQLAVFPGVAMRSATILQRAKWHLTAADLLTGLDVGLEHAVDWWIGMVELGRTFARTPNAAVAHRHTRAILGVLINRIEQFALEIKKPYRLLEAVMTLLGNPKPPSLGVGSDGVRIAWRRQKQLRDGCL